MENPTPNEETTTPNEEISLEDLIILQDAEANDLPSTLPNTEDPKETEESNSEDPKESEDSEDLEPEISEESDPTPDSTPESSDNPYQNYFDHLSESNFLHLPEEFEFDGTAESLEEAFRVSEDNKMELIKQSIVNSIPQEGRNLLRHLVNGGSVRDYTDTLSDVPLNQLDANNVSHQRKIVAQHFRETTTYNEEKIERMVNRLSDLDALQETAEESLSELKELEAHRQEQLAQQTEQARLQAKQKAQQDKIAFDTAIKSSKSIAPKRKSRVKAFMFNEVTRDGRTSTDYNRVLAQISSNPEHVVQLADILMDYSLEKGFSMERHERRGKSKAATSFRTSLQSKIDPKSKVSGKSNIVSEDQIDWEAILAQQE